MLKLHEPLGVVLASLAGLLRVPFLARVWTLATGQGDTPEAH